MLIVKLGERIERGDVRLVEIDDISVRVDRSLDIFDFVGEDLRNESVEVDLGLAVERGSDVTLVRVDQIEPLTKLAIVTFEGKISLFVIRVDFDDLLESLRRDVRFEEMLLLKIRRDASRRRCAHARW